MRRLAKFSVKERAPLTFKQALLADKLANAVFAGLQALPEDERLACISEVVLLLRSDVGMDYCPTLERPPWLPRRGL